MGQLDERSRGDLTSFASLQLIEAAKQPRAWHEEVGGEGIGESLGFWRLTPVADERDLGPIPRNQEVRVLVGEGPATALGWMTSVQSDAATQWLHINKETSHSGRQRLDEDPESHIDLKNLTKPLDRTIADTQSVTLLCCQVLRCLSGIEMIDPPDRRILSRRSCSSSAQQVEVVIREVFQPRD